MPGAKYGAGHLEVELDWRSWPYTLPLLICAMLSWGLAVWAWQRRNTSTHLAFSVLMSAIGIWTLGYAFEVAITQYAIKIMWAKIEYLGIVTIPITWLIFTAYYSGQFKWLAPRNIALLCIVPALTLIIVWTNEWHRWIWLNTDLDTNLGFAIIRFTYGPFFWVHTVYAYVALLTGTILLIGAFVRAAPLYRRQVGLVLLGAIIPWIGNAVYLSGLSPFPGFDLTPLTFTLTGLVIGVALFRFRLLDIMPIARSIVIDNIDDGVIVVDAQGRIVDINPAASRLIGIREHAVGRPLDQVLSDYVDLIEQYRTVERLQTELRLVLNDEERYINLRILPVYDRLSRLMARLIVLEDISRRKQIEMTLAAQSERQSALYRFLTRLGSLLDPQQIARTAVDEVLYLGRWTAVALLLPDSDQEQLIVAATAGPFSLPEQTRLPLDTHPLSHVFRDAKVKQWSEAERHILAVPLEHGGRKLGVLAIEHVQQTPLDQDSIILAQSLGEVIALALDNAQLYEQARQNATDLNTLYTVTQLAGRSLTQSETLNAVLKPIVETFAFDGGLISIADNERLRIVAYVGMSHPGMPAPTEWDLTDTGCDRVYHTQKSLIITGMEPEMVDRRVVERLNAMGFFAYVGVPICYRNQCIGTVALLDKRPRRFSNRQITLLETLSSQLAPAILNAQIYEETARERALLETIINANHDGIIMIGDDGRVRVVNTAALSLLKLPGRPADWIGLPIQEVLLRLRTRAPQAARATIAELHRIAQGDHTDGEGEYTVPPHIIHWHNFAVDGQGTANGRLLVLHDVTEARQLEQMREDLTHTMVHDLRNPLTGISVSLNLLAEKAKDRLTPAQQRVLELGQSSTQKMLALVNTILDVSRLENRQMPLNRVSASLYDVASEAVDSQMVLAAEKNLNLQNHLSPDLPPVEIDVGLIERVLINLIGNSVKFTPNGGLIRLSARVVPAGVQVTVYNNGPHIPSEMLGRLFERFVTGQQTGSGSGLGLAFCKLAVEAHGGRIWAENIYPDNGVAFHFTLPVAENPKGLGDL